MSKPIPLNDTMDAKIWADEFMHIFGNRLLDIDHDTMHGWFANAIMVGYDFANMHQRERSSNEGVENET